MTRPVAFCLFQIDRLDFVCWCWESLKVLGGLVVVSLVLSSVVFDDIGSCSWFAHLAF